MPSTEATARAECTNCGRHLGDPRPRFCPHCGQETNLRPPRIGEFLQQFGGAYLATEGALWRTLGLLLFKPGELTLQYLAGRRKHYVLPLRLYLTISLVALLAVRLASSDLDVQMPSDAQIQRDARIALGVGHAGLKGGTFYCTDLPDWVCRRLKRRLDLDPKAMVLQAEQLKERYLGNLGGAMFVMLPAFALWLRLVYLNRRLRYTEHLVFALHLHAFWFLAIALMTTGVPAIVLAALAAMPMYAALAARRVYGGRWWATLLRGGVVTAAYAVTLLAALAAVAVWTFVA